jgi:hypothetical protein
MIEAETAFSAEATDKGDSQPILRQLEVLKILKMASP